MSDEIFDPYEVLEVPYRAAQSEITKAYRRACSKTHPDRHPGDPDVQREMNEEMQRLNRAWAAIGTPEAREAFDATGKEGPVDPSHKRAANLLMDMWRRGIGQYEGHEADYHAFAVATLRNAAGEFRKSREKLIGQVTHTKQRMRRLVRRRDGGRNLFAELVDGIARDLEAQIAQVDEDLRINLLAQELAMEYEGAYEDAYHIALAATPPIGPEVYGIRWGGT